MSYQPASQSQLNERNQLANWVRSMGRKCYIDGNKLAVEIEHQTPNGAVYTTTEYVSSMSEAEKLICDE